MKDQVGHISTLFIMADEGCWAFGKSCRICKCVFYALFLIDYSIVLFNNVCLVSPTLEGCFTRADDNVWLPNRSRYILPGNNLHHFMPMKNTDANVHLGIFQNTSVPISWLAYLRKRKWGTRKNISEQSEMVVKIIGASTEYNCNLWKVERL